MRSMLVIMGSEASCYRFHTFQPTRIRGAQEVLTFLPCREAIKSKERSNTEIGGSEGKAIGAACEPGT